MEIETMLGLLIVLAIIASVQRTISNVGKDISKEIRNKKLPPPLPDSQIDIGLDD